MNKRALLVLVLVVAVAAGYIGLKEWNRGLAQADDVKADVVITATELFNAYTSDETAANARFNDRAVQVSGTVREVSSDAGGPVNVMLETGDPLGAVVCEFAAGTVLELKKDAQVTVKGFCAGYNLDVLLQRCTIVE
jgi:hypothetical protein